MKDKSHDTAMAEVFRNDSAYAVELLNSILEDGAQDELLIALRQMTEAFGGVRSVAKSAKLNPNQLYKTLSADGNPVVSNLSTILRVMGLRLAIKPLSTNRITKAKKSLALEGKSEKKSISSSKKIPKVGKPKLSRRANKNDLPKKTPPLKKSA
jgi:DNA-binding phage protein